MAIETARQTLASTPLGRESLEDEAQLLEAIAGILNEIGIQLTARRIGTAGILEAISEVQKYSSRRLSAQPPCTCGHEVSHHSTIGCEVEVYRDGGPTVCACSWATGLTSMNSRGYAEELFKSS